MGGENKFMRRKDREVTNPKKITEIIQSCHCCRLGFCDHGSAYIVPLNFGYEENEKERIFYFHGANEGRKVELIKQGESVGFEMDSCYTLCEAENACGYSARFQSIIGTGLISIIEEPQEKIHALNTIMFHYTGKRTWNYPKEALNTVCVFKLKVLELSCKVHC